MAVRSDATSRCVVLRALALLLLTAWLSVACDTSRNRPSRSSGTLGAGPYRMVDVGDPQQAPLYLIPFDKFGNCQAPRTREHLVNAVNTGDFTDIFIFSHGWNNDWAAATSRYDHFIAHYQQMRRERRLTYGRDFRPLFVGIIWPSTALVWDSESGPTMASLGADVNDDAAVDQSVRELMEVAAGLQPPAARRLYELWQIQELSESEARELAELLAPLHAADHDELVGTVPAPAPAQLTELWQRSVPTAANPPTFGPATSTAPSAASAPKRYGLARDIIRLTTVWMMKDRAGTVGAFGVGPLLDDVLRSSARVHLIGHSYGCKVVLSALCHAPKPRPVNSVLLLQPAISALCFAADVDESSRPGGYREALNRVEQPILTTFSKHDVPLTRVFHLAVRRASDLGEARIAAPQRISKYAALGGFGPQGISDEAQVVAMKPVGERYSFDASSVRVVGLNADDRIMGHGDVSVPATWWALYDQLAR